MLNKKRLFALLMVGALLPTCVSAMDEGNAAPEAPVAAAPAEEAVPAGYLSQAFSLVDKGCDAVNTPLTLAMQKVTAFGAKSKLLITGLLAYIGYRVAPAVVEDVQELPNAVKSLVGVDADCAGSECRRGTAWTDQA